MITFNSIKNRNYKFSPRIKPHFVCPGSAHLLNILNSYIYFSFIVIKSHLEGGIISVCIRAYGILTITGAGYVWAMLVLQN
jgi:hypothetical protein